MVKQRRKRGELERCFACPGTHPGWKRSELRNRRRVPYCPEHLAALEENRPVWPPRCPQCGDADFGILIWGGTVEKTKISCEVCDFSDLALDHVDRLTIITTARPILYEHTASAKR